MCNVPDLDSITLDDLSLGSTGPAIGDPALIIREYLHPRDQQGPNRPGRDHRLKVWQLIKSVGGEHVRTGVLHRSLSLGRRPSAGR